MSPQSREEGPPADGYARVFRDLLKLIDEHGWAVRNVGAGGNEGEACFSYTVGLTAFRHPEVVITGMPHKWAHRFLNLIGDEVRRGKRYEHGAVTDEFTDGASVVFLRAEVTEDLTAVEQVYGRVNAVQMVWPDSTGRLPWQEGYRNGPLAQPLLGPLPSGSS